MAKFIKVYCLTIFISIMVLPMAFIIYMVKHDGNVIGIYEVKNILNVFYIYDVYLPIMNLVIMVGVALPFYQKFNNLAYGKSTVIFVYAQLVSILTYSIYFFWRLFDFSRSFEKSDFVFLFLSIIQGLLFAAIFKWLYFDFYGQKAEVYDV